MDMLQIAHQNVHQAQEHIKKYADKHQRRPITFDKGEHVFL